MTAMRLDGVLDFGDGVARTGKAMGDYLAQPKEDYPVYAQAAFEALKTAIASCMNAYRTEDWEG